MEVMGEPLVVYKVFIDYIKSSNLSSFLVKVVFGLLKSQLLSELRINKFSKVLLFDNLPIVSKVEL